MTQWDKAMEYKQFADTELLRLLVGRYGTKSTVMYYLRRAKDASGRAKVSLANQNPHTLGAEAQVMIDNIEMIYKILGDDTNIIEDVDIKASK